MTDLNQVRQFWESNPLWTGESAYGEGTRAFYDEHRKMYITDCFAGLFDIRFLPPPRSNGQEMRILDIGCRIGFWTAEFGMRGFTNIFAADLTQKALDLTKKRLDIYGISAELSMQNAESMTFVDDQFDHVNYQEVIHHTPDTQAAISEIARVLKPGGSASISVYYRNVLLRSWKCLRWVGWPLMFLGGGLKGRGREKIFAEGNIDEIVRLYDGSENPIGKSYTRKQFIDMLERHFIVQQIYLHFFPARSLPFTIPKVIHRWLDKHLGLMIYATVRKPCAE